jgi:hypothetical protein
MGRAHPKRADGVTEKRARQEILKSLDATEGRVRAAMGEMAQRTEAAWAAFKQRAGTAP